MIRVTVGNNMSRKNVIVSEDTTIRQILEENEVDYTRTAMCLDGATLQPGDIDRPIGDFGIVDRCFLLGVQKTDNACSNLKNDTQDDPFLAMIEGRSVKRKGAFRRALDKLFGC